MEIGRGVPHLFMKKIHGLLHFFPCFMVGHPMVCSFSTPYFVSSGTLYHVFGMLLWYDPCTCLIRLNKGFSNHLGINF